MARAAMVAVEPLVELFLELGITSPEAESLLRSLFVHGSRRWLASQGNGSGPSDVRVSLVTGVHRNFVRRLLREPPKIAEARQRKGRAATRLLRAWHTDARYLDGSGKPRDLPEKGRAPSFESLARTHLRGPAPGVVLRELERAGVVERLPEQRVRARSRSMRLPGMNLSNIREIGLRSRQLIETLMGNLRGAQDSLFYDSLSGIEVAQARLPVVREVINRRATAFLQSLEAELATERRRRPTSRSDRRVRLSITVFEAKG
jgi:Family of unknown function (DUF6502)